MTTQAAIQYVCQTTEGGSRIGDTRVSLDSIVRAYWEGKSPEAIVEEFPTLVAEQVYGAIAFYLRNRDEVDKFLSEQDAKWDQARQASERVNGPMLERLRARRTSFENQDSP